VDGYFSEITNIYNAKDAAGLDECLYLFSVPGMREALLEAKTELVEEM
jgi:hypothetical protein